MASRPDSWVVQKNLAIRWIYALCSVVLIAVHPLLSEIGRLGVVRLVSLISLLAIVVGARANKVDGRVRTWVVLFVAGLIVVNVGLMVELVPGALAVALSEVLNAVGNVVLFAAAMTAVYTRVPTEPGAVIDMAIIGLAVGGLIWNFGLLPRQQAAGRSIVSQVDALLVVFALAGVLGAVVRLRQASEGRLTPLWFLAAGLIFALGGHVTDILAGHPREYAPASVPFMASYTCVALFGLDPASYQLLRPGPGAGERLSSGRLWFLGIAVATLPVALGLSDIVGGRVNGTLLVFGGGLVTALVMVRIRWLSVERLHAEQALRHMASHDPLTDLVNRREFMDQLTDERSRGRRDVILFCDLDKFKDVNDNLGHSAGDRLLVEVANRLVSAVRESDTVARLGGDEFIILLRGAEQAEVAAILERISALLSQPIEVSGRSVDVDASIGVVTAHDLDPEELLKQADHAMYRAKQSAPTKRGVRVVSA